MIYLALIKKAYSKHDLGPCFILSLLAFPEVLLKALESTLRARLQGYVLREPGSYVLGMSYLALGKWGRTHIGTAGLTGSYFFSPVGVRLVPLKTNDFKGFRPILTGLNLVQNCSTPPRPTPLARCRLRRANPQN